MGPVITGSFEKQAPGRFALISWFLGSFVYKFSLQYIVQFQALTPDNLTVSFWIQQGWVFILCKTLFMQFLIIFSVQGTSSRLIMHQNPCSCIWHSKMSMAQTKHLKSIQANTVLLRIKLVEHMLVWWISWMKLLVTSQGP